MAPFSLFAALLGAMPSIVHAGAATFPLTVEVDLIFPRNDAYAPSALIPVVFAFQNAALVSSLDPGFDLTLWGGVGSNSTGRSLALDLKAANLSSSNPTYVYTYITGLDTIDGGAAASYRLTWAFSAGNCSDTDGALAFGGGFWNNSVEFTIESGGRPIDLVAATESSADCTNMSHFAFNLTGTLDVPVAAQYDGRNSCAVFSNWQPLVRGNPCAVQVGSATASSISAALTATACAAANPVVTCPSQNGASEAWKTEYALFQALVGTLLAIVLAW